jgi:hypothetical protein
MKLDFVITLIFASILRGLCINIEVLNKNVIFCRSIDSILEVQVHYSDISEYNLAEEHSTLCLTVNGRECKCYDSYMTETIIFSKECTVDEFHWFAITITTSSLKSAAISYPILVPSNKEISYQDKLIKLNMSDQSTLISSERSATFYDSVTNMITLVLPVTIDDISRCIVLFNSLLFVQKGVIFEMLIYVPHSQYDLIKIALEEFISILNFPVFVIPESHLFQRKEQPSAFPYAIQMAIKLLVSRFVKTNYYLTLDADVILLQPLRIDQMLLPLADKKNDASHNITYKCHNDTSKDDSNASLIRRKALYEHEERSLHHPQWWIGSESLLKISSEDPHLQGFGVTPAIMSTFGNSMFISVIS